MRFDNGAFELAARKVRPTSRAGDLPEIVFSGKSNAGKSSLINKLLNRKKFSPGQRDAGERRPPLIFTAWIKPDWRICPAMVTPRYPWRRKNAGRSWWKDTPARKESRLVVQLVDMRHPPKDDLHMMEFLCDGGFPFLVALTKSDKLNQTERRQRLAALEAAFSD